MDLKQDLRCDTIDTREEYEMKVRIWEGPAPKGPLEGRGTRIAGSGGGQSGGEGRWCTEAGSGDY